MQEVSVIIPNFNGMAYLDGVLSGLECQTVRNFEVILVDNGSSDGSCAFVASSYPWVHMIELPENFGFCKAVNEGIKASRAPYVLLLNNDIEVTPDFIEEMLAAIRRHKKAFSCAARMIQFHDRDRLDDAGNYYCALGWAYARGKGRIFIPVKKRRKSLPPVQGQPSTEERFSRRSVILMRNILPIWKIWMWDTVQGSTDTRTGMRRRQWFTMWEAEPAVPATIISRPVIPPETMSI